MRTQGSRLPKTSTETHRGCSPGTSHSLLPISPLRSARPAPPQRRVLGAPSCPAAVTARSGDAWSSSRVRAACDPARQWQRSGRGLEPSGSPESGSGGTWETGAARGIPTPTPGAAGPRPAAFPSRLSRPWGRASRRARVGAAPVSSREGRVDRGVIPSRPGHRRGRHHRGAGPRPGAGRRAGAALFPASPEAPLALRWEPSWREKRIQRGCEERRRRRRETGGGRTGAGDRGGARRRALSLFCLSPRRPHGAPLGAGGDAGP